MSQHQLFSFSSSEDPSQKPKVIDSQDDFFTELKSDLVKIDELKKDEIKEQAEFDYEGRLADRVTEEEYETENLMTYD